MKKGRKKVLILMLTLAVSVLYCGCTQTKDIVRKVDTEKNSDDKEKSKEDIDIIEVNIDSKFITISGKSAEELAENIKEGGDCLEVKQNEDGTLTVEITEQQQQEYWLPSRGELMEELQEQLQEYDENYRLEHNDSYTQVDAYYNLDLPVDKAVVYVRYAEFLCASYQIFSGVDDDKWKVTINVYNSDTGKLVKTGDSDVDLEYDDSDWEASK